MWPELHRLHRRGLDARLSGMQTSQDQSPRDVISLFGKPLSHREVQIVDLVAAGMLNKQIAHELHLEVGTIKMFVSVILAKTGMANRTALAVWWVLQKLKTL